MDLETKVLLRRVGAGDQPAATELYQRYVNRLIGLAKSRLSERMAQRVDPEDVVQSVYRSFFAKASDGQFELKRSGDLWRLLSAITINKVLKKVEHHQALKRDYRREQLPIPSNESSVIDANSFAVEPTDEEAMAVAEVLETLMGTLNPEQREMLERRLQGATYVEVSEHVGCSERMVRRFLEGVKQRLRERLFDLG